jgi:aquaporin TIP
MSSSLEVQGKGYNQYGEEAQGLVETGQANSLPAPAKPTYQDDDGIIPVILEDYLERAGVM